MRYYDGVKTATSSLFTGVAATALSLLTLSSPVQGMADNVQVMVCPQPDQSSLTVHQPQSDSIISEPILPIGGSIEYISQIDFFIDNVYNNTVAMGYSATEFASTVTMDPGTHTIKLVATDSCSQTTHEYSLVVTYEPKIPPSVGENIETVVDGQIKQGRNISTAPEPAKNSIEKAIDRFVIPSYESAKEVLDISDPVAVDPAVRAGNVARSLLFTVGALLSLSAVHIGALSASVLPDRLVSLLPFRRRAMAGFALIGLLLMLLVFIV